MLISILLILILAVGGFALSYLIDSDGPFLWRSAAGVVLGSAIYGTTTFLIACFTGLAVASPVGIVLTLTPLLIFRDRERRKHFRTDWQRAKNKMQGGSPAKILRFAFYAFFFLLFCAFFSQAMYQTPLGIYTGGAQNGGDLPFHLGAVFSFTDGSNFPPQNPSFAGAKFSYPFIADMATAGFLKFGPDIRGALIVQDIAWAFSLLLILERFVFKLTADRLAGKIAPWLLFFSGGLGFIWFLSDYWSQGKGLFDFLSALPREYSIGEDFKWGNSLTTLFITQRSLLLGMPLTIIVFQSLWQWFRNERPTSEKVEPGDRALISVASFRPYLGPFLIGLVAGMLPLVHLHSLVVLFVVTFFLFGLDPENWKVWIAFGIGVCVIAIPELAWSVVGSASKASEFIDWNFGWDKGEANIIWFWFKNTGVFILLVILGVYLSYRSNAFAGTKLRLFALPFLLLFIIANVAKLAPWPWDNIKVLIYCFVGALPFAAFAISWIWQKSKYSWALGLVILISLIFSGSLDVWRTSSSQVKFLLFDPDAVRIAEQIKSKTPARSLFLNAATYNTAVALTGRQSLMRYPGHLYSYGIDYSGREADVKAMYQGGPTADQLLKKYNIDYVLVSQEETRSMSVNQEYFMKFPAVASAGGATVYKVR